jgi:pimeloyl-ACP methyl ester carboxylesterase
MGGLIAQRMAFHHAHRLRSLTLMMTWSGSRLDGLPHPRAVLALLQTPAKSREENGRLMVRTHRALAGSLPVDEDESYRLGVRAYDRAAGRPVGAGRHLLAVLAGGNQRRALSRVRTPTTILHGAEDPIIPASGGRSLARHIRDSHLHIYPGMGHQLPPVLWPAFCEEVVRVARRGGFDPGVRAAS